MSAAGHAAAALSLPWTLALAALLSVYAAGVRRRRRDGLHTALWPLLAFLSGTLVLWLVLASPLGQLDHQRLTAHMLQHLLVMNVGAPLLLLGQPLEMADALAPGLVARLATGRARPALRALGHPAVCWLSGTLVVLLFHLPAVLQRTLASPGWHLLQQGCFLLAGLLFWWPVVRPWPEVARWPLVLYLFVATLPCDALSAFLAFCGRVVYPHYAQAVGGAAALADQQLAGALMWCFVTLAYLFPAVVLALRLLGQRSSAARR